jgi:hypothetical protein
VLEGDGLTEEAAGGEAFGGGVGVSGVSDERLPAVK